MELDAAYSPDTLPFPALECLDLYDALIFMGGMREVSGRMHAELRRCYERVEEWEVQVATVGRAEWLRREGLSL